METVFCRLADLILGIETIAENAISARNTAGFATEATTPDILFRFHPLHRDELVVSPVAKAEIASLSGRFRCFNGHWNVPFLAEERLRRLIGTLQPLAESVSLELTDSLVRVQDFQNKTLDVFHPADTPSDALFSYQGEFFLAPFLSRVQGILLHGSAVVRGERAVLFLGPDAAGKTTAASSQSGPILCDDQVILRWSGEGFQTYGTPWGRIFQSSLAAPLGALVLLEQAPDFSLTTVQPREMFAYIWDEHPYYHLPLPISFRSEAFELVHRLCRSVPLFHMRFGIDNIDWSAIDAVLGGPERI